MAELSFGVGPAKVAKLYRRLEKVGVQEKDLKEHFVRSRGAGGQKTNKTSSAVILKHPPSNTEVRCEEERSQSLNRYRARVRLAELLEGRSLGRQSPAALREAKKRKQKQRRQRRAKQKLDGSGVDTGAMDSKTDKA